MDYIEDLMLDLGVYAAGLFGAVILLVIFANLIRDALALLA